MKITLYTPGRNYVYLNCELEYTGYTDTIRFIGTNQINHRRTIVTSLPYTIEIGTPEEKEAVTGTYDGNLVNNLLEITDKVRRVVTPNSPTRPSRLRNHSLAAIRRTRSPTRTAVCSQRSSLPPISSFWAASPSMSK